MLKSNFPGRAWIGTFSASEIASLRSKPYVNPCVRDWGRGKTTILNFLEEASVNPRLSRAVQVERRRVGENLLDITAKSRQLLFVDGMDERMQLFRSMKMRSLDPDALEYFRGETCSKLLIAAGKIDQGLLVAMLQDEAQNGPRAEDLIDRRSILF